MLRTASLMLHLWREMPNITVYQWKYLIIHHRNKQHTLLLKRHMQIWLFYFDTSRCSAGCVASMEINTIKIGDWHQHQKHHCSQEANCQITLNTVLMTLLCPYCDKMLNADNSMQDKTAQNDGSRSDIVITENRACWEQRDVWPGSAHPANGHRFSTSDTDEQCYTC